MHPCLGNKTVQNFKLIHRSETLCETTYPVPAPAREAELNGGRGRGLVHQILKIIAAISDYIGKNKQRRAVCESQTMEEKQFSPLTSK